MFTLQWHLLKGRSKPAHPEAQPSKQLRQVSLQSRCRLLQDGNSQVVGGGKAQSVAVVADLPMRPPGPSGDAPALMMCRQAAKLSHKAKRGLRCHPGKPRWGIWLKGEQSALGTDYHVMPLAPILDARDDMSWLAGRFGCGTRAGSRESRLG